MHELPLVFFTVFTQSAVGAFILLLIGGAMGLVAPRRKAIGLFSVMCLFGLGVIVGIFHVGQPLRALNMLLRVGHSPMSNEIVLSAAFAALGGLGALGLLLNRATPLCNALVWLAAIVGVVFLLRRSADLPTADGGDLAFILHHGNDDIDAVDWRRRVGGIVWRAPSGATGQRVGDFGELLSAPGLYGDADERR